MSKFDDICKEYLTESKIAVNDIVRYTDDKDGEEEGFFVVSEVLGDRAELQYVLYDVKRKKLEKWFKNQMSLTVAKVNDLTVVGRVTDKDLKSKLA
jgi:hypothetical protein